MMKCLYLVSVVFHVAAGCALSGDNNLGEITRHKGDSVLFPCSCSDLNTKPQKFTWETGRTGRFTEVLNDEHYRGRFQLFNNISPANLSLLLSDLREEDEGVYRCRTEREHRDIRLYVKVVLPCVCTDLQDKPKSVQWEFSRESGTNSFQEIYPEQTRHHSNRLKLVSKNPPGNLSLLISDLTEEDQGDYRCSVQTDRRNFSLSVKVRRRGTSTPPSEQNQSKTTNSPPAASPTTLEQGKQQTHSSLPIVFGILAALLLVIPGVVTFICWRCRGGRCGENRITEEHPDWKRKQKDQTGPDATYSTVTYINTWSSTGSDQRWREN